MNFTDAQQMHRDHPATFEVPSANALSAVAVGAYVKICAEPERFWVRVTARNSGQLVGIIDNELLRTEQHGLQLGDEVTFEERHIYQIHRDH